MISEDVDSWQIEVYKNYVFETQLFCDSMITHIKIADINRDHKVQHRNCTSNQKNPKEEEKAILPLLSIHPKFMSVVILVVDQIS